MRTLTASPDEPRPVVTGGGYTYTGPGYTIAWNPSPHLVPMSVTTSPVGPATR